MKGPVYESEGNCHQETMSEHVERNLQRNLRGMTLTNYRTVGDVRAIRKCERINQQIGRTRHQMDKIYASDLKTANMEVEFRQVNVSNIVNSND